LYWRFLTFHPCSQKNIQSSFPPHIGGSLYSTQITFSIFSWLPLRLPGLWIRCQQFLCIQDKS
jgi:hypothetical protein